MKQIMKEYILSDSLDNLPEQISIKTSSSFKTLKVHRDKKNNILKVSGIEDYDDMFHSIKKYLITQSNCIFDGSVNSRFIGNFKNKNQKIYHVLEME